MAQELVQPVVPGDVVRGAEMGIGRTGIWRHEQAGLTDRDRLRTERPGLRRPSQPVAGKCPVGREAVKAHDARLVSCQSPPQPRRPLPIVREAQIVHAAARALHDVGEPDAVLQQGAVLSGS